MGSEQLELFQYDVHKEAKLSWVELSLCQPHPMNPRMAQNDDIITRIAEQIGQIGFQPQHAILIRPVNNHYEIVSGHHRVAACAKAGLDKILAWVAFDMTEEEAHTLLLLENDQSELSALEKGKHAYEHIELYGKSDGGRGNTGGIREYARRHNYNSDEIVRQWMSAYEVVLKTAKLFGSLSPTVLYEISKAPEAAWPALCKYAEAEEWTVETTKTATKKVSQILNILPQYDIADIYDKATANKAKKSQIYTTLFGKISEYQLLLPESVKLYKFYQTDETKTDNYQILRKYIGKEYVYNAKSTFMEQIQSKLPADATAVDGIYKSILKYITENNSGGEKWLPELSEAEVAERQALEERRQIQSFLDNHIWQADMMQAIYDISDKTVDLVITDPPYGLGKTADIEFKNRADMSTTKGDWDKVVHYIDWIPEIKRVMKPTASIYIFVGDREIGNLYNTLLDNEFLIHNIIVWHKTNPAVQVRQRQYVFATELIVFATLTDEYTFNWHGQNEMHSMIEMPICAGNERLDHPTQKPLALIDHFIKVSSNIGDFIFDPFAGVGTTGIAAYKLERDFILIEQERNYHQQSRIRLQKAIRQS